MHGRLPRTLTSFSFAKSAKGTTGIFVKRDGSRAEYGFNDLSAPDQAYLTELLGDGSN